VVRAITTYPKHPGQRLPDTIRNHAKRVTVAEQRLNTLQSQNAYLLAQNTAMAAQVAALQAQPSDITMDNVATGDQVITATSGSPALFTGLSGIAIPGAGHYRIIGQIFWTQNTAAVSQAFGFQGSRLTSGTRVLCQVIATTGSVNSVNCFQLTTNTAGITATTFASGTTVYVINFEGLLVFSAADTFGLQGYEGTSGDSWTVKSGSWLDLMPE
jgi:hypothetical protein